MIKHKDAHFETGKILGYNPVYGYREKRFKFFPFSLILRTPSVNIDEKVKPKDIAEICLVPTEPSITDKFRATKAFPFMLLKMLLKKMNIKNLFFRK